MQGELDEFHEAKTFESEVWIQDLKFKRIWNSYEWQSVQKGRVKVEWWQENDLHCDILAAMNEAVSDRDRVHVTIDRVFDCVSLYYVDGLPNYIL